MLAGGGNFKIINRTVPLALKMMGYNPAQVREIDDYVLAEGTIEGAPHLALHKAVMRADFLFILQLAAINRQLPALVGAMLAWAVWALV